MDAARRQAQAMKTLDELKRQREAARDYIFPAKQLAMDATGELILRSQKSFRVGDRVYTEWADAEAAADESGEALESMGDTGRLALGPTAEGQLATKLGIPMSYIKRLVAGENADLAARNFDTLLGRDNRRFLVRTLDGRIRAVLSDSYRVLDSWDLVQQAAAVFEEKQVAIWDARIADDSFYLFGVSQEVQAEVERHCEAHGPSQHAFQKFGDEAGAGEGNAPDTHYAAIRLTNSETGQGGLTVRPSILREVCSNLMVVGDSLRQIHLGRRRSEEGLVYADDTRQAESRAVWLKVRDTVRTVFDAAKFQEYIDQLRGQTQVKVEEPRRSVEHIVKGADIPEASVDDIMANFWGGRDSTGYGLVQAFTATGRDLAANDPDGAALLEETGGAIAQGKYAAAIA